MLFYELFKALTRLWSGVQITLRPPGKTAKNSSQTALRDDSESRRFGALRGQIGAFWGPIWGPAPSKYPENFGRSFFVNLKIPVRAPSEGPNV